MIMALSPLPPLATTTVGSFPRTSNVQLALKHKRLGKIGDAEFDPIADEAVRDVVRLQEEVGLDLVTDGEQRRDNFYSFVSEKLDGVRLMSLAEMLDIVEDKVGFEKLLQSLDDPAYSIHNPTCVGKVKRRQPLATHELSFLKSITALPVKIPLPGPYILTRAMWVPEASGAFYDSKEALADDVVQVLREEVEELIAGGADFIQFDEPVLTELVFTQGNTRTFMCAALAARKDPAEELQLAVELINRVVAGFEDHVRFGVHVCRGNWSRDESTLLSGSYAPLHASFQAFNVHQLVLEYATPRAGDLIDFPGKELGLGAVNPRTDTIEDEETIIERVREAMAIYPAERLFLNPDCGFGTFSARPMNEWDVIKKKLNAMVSAAKRIRSE